MPARNGSVHVATTTRTYKGKVYQSHLLRRSYREGSKVKHQTLGNLSHLPPDLIDIIRQRLRSGQPQAPEPWEIIRSLPHGNVLAVLGPLRALKLEALLGSSPCRERDLVVAMIVARIISPASKLATARSLKEQTATSTLSLELKLGDVQEEELYLAMDWLLERQGRIETKLAKKHLQDGTLILYDVSGSYYTGHQSELIKFGHNRDGKKRFPQIVYGLLCNAKGCPVAIEVFAGNTADSNTLASQIQKIQRRFAIDRVVMVGDRGLITSRRIEDDLRGVAGLDWITALRADSIKKLASQGVIQSSLFDQRDLAEVTSPDFPDERLIVCHNPFLAEERSRKRTELLAATENTLNEIAAATQRKNRPLRGKEKIGLRIGKVLNKHKVGKHFKLVIGESSFTFSRNEQKIADEASLDGIYVIRTSVKQEDISSEQAVHAYKDLSKVERAFRSMKTVDLKVRPIYHWLDDRIRAHVFLCMLAYYVEWHLRDQLATILFDDHDKSSAEATRQSVVAPAPRSQAAKQKDANKRTADDTYPVHSFRTLLQDLATLTKNLVRLKDQPGSELYMLTKPTPLQQHALDLLGVSL